MALSIEVVESRVMPAHVMQEVRALCTDAYGEDAAAFLAPLDPGVHLLGRAGGVLVCHAMWVTRWLQPGGQEALLRTAYVEAVATGRPHQRRGFATQVLARLAEEIRDYDLGALSPSNEALYAGLAWERWRGPLSIRTDAGLLATPDESVMILRLPRTPPDLDLKGPLTAEWRKGELW